MRFDSRLYFLLTMLCTSLLFTLLALTGHFGRPSAWEEMVAAGCGVASTFFLGKHLRDRAH